MAYLQNYKDFTEGSTFRAIIISLLSPNRGLFYVLEESQFENFQLIETYQPTNSNKYKEPPEFGQIFLYKKDAHTYRAFRIRTNSAAMRSVSMFLVDVGQRITVSFEVGPFFKMPNDFNHIQALGIFCCLESFPPVNAMKLKSDFLKSHLFKTVLFKIVRNDRMANALAKSQRCLIVNAEESGETEAMSEGVPNDHMGLMKPLMKPKKIHPRLRYLEDSNGNSVPFKVDGIARKSTLPEPGSKIIIHFCQIVSFETFNARIIKQGSMSGLKLQPDAMALYRWMNSRSTVESYQALPKQPEVGDMVVGIGRDSLSLHNRALVIATREELCKVLFVDYGYTQNFDWMDLYKFPRDFSSLPFQATKIVIANMFRCINEEILGEIKEIIRAELESRAFAEVVSSRRMDQLDELSVKLYNANGEDIVDIIRERIDHH